MRYFMNFLKKIFNIRPKAPKDLFLDEMAEILKLNVALPWDSGDNIFKDRVNTYKQDQLDVEKEKGELHYWHSKNDEPKYTERNIYNLSKAYMNFQGFSLTYNVVDDSYYLSLHLRTIDDFRYRIHDALEKNFDNVKRRDGNFIKGFTFNKKDLKKVDLDG